MREPHQRFEFLTNRLKLIYQQASTVTT